MINNMAMSKALAPLRIEVLLNGRRVAIAGIEEFGVISAVVSWVRRNPHTIPAAIRAGQGFDEAEFLRERCELEFGGLDSVAGQHVFWAKELLRPGSEVTIRILGAGEFDPPRPEP